MLHDALGLSDVWPGLVSLFLLPSLLSLRDSSHLIVGKRDVDFIPRLLLNDEEILFVIDPWLDGPELSLVLLLLLHLVLLLLHVMRRTAVAEIIEVEHISAVVAGACSCSSLFLPPISLVFQLFEVVLLATEAQGAASRGTPGNLIVTWAAFSVFLRIVVVGIAFWLLNEVVCPTFLANVARAASTATSRGILFLVVGIGAAPVLHRSIRPLVAPRNLLLFEVGLLHVIVGVNGCDRLILLLVVTLPHALDDDADQDQENGDARAKVQGYH